MPDSEDMVEFPKNSFERRINFRNGISLSLQNFRLAWVALDGLEGERRQNKIRRAVLILGLTRAMVLLAEERILLLTKLKKGKEFLSDPSDEGETFEI